MTLVGLASFGLSCVFLFAALSPQPSNLMMFLNVHARDCDATLPEKPGWVNLFLFAYNFTLPPLNPFYVLALIIHVTILSLALALTAAFRFQSLGRSKRCPHQKPIRSGRIATVTSNWLTKLADLSIRGSVLLLVLVALALGSVVIRGGCEKPPSSLDEKHQRACRTFLIQSFGYKSRAGLHRDCLLKENFQAFYPLAKLADTNTVALLDPRKPEPDIINKLRLDLQRQTATSKTTRTSNTGVSRGESRGDSAGSSAGVSRGDSRDDSGGVSGGDVSSLDIPGALLSRSNCKSMPDGEKTVGECSKAEGGCLSDTDFDAIEFASEAQSDGCMVKRSRGDREIKIESKLDDLDIRVKHVQHNPLIVSDSSMDFAYHEATIAAHNLSKQHSTFSRGVTAYSMLVACFSVYAVQYALRI